MTTDTLVARSMPAPMTFFERYLTLWVLLCIVAAAHQSGGSILLTFICA